MKTRITFIVLLGLTCRVCHSQQVSYTEAVKVTENELIFRNGIQHVNIDTVFELHGQSNSTLLYEIRTREGKTVLVSGDKSSRPVLAIIDNTNNLSVLHVTDSLPCGMKIIVEGYKRQIEYIVENGVRSSRYNNEWTNYLVTPTSLQLRNSVQLGSKWGEKESNDGLDFNAYNGMAPIIGNCQCPAGCATVSMGQIMKYWEYPFFMTSNSNLYNWCNIPNELYTNNPCYEKEKKAISSLLRECGTSTNTSYNCFHSSTGIEYVLDAMIGTFYFSEDAYIQNMDMTILIPYEESPWIITESIISSEIGAGRPFIMMGKNQNDNIYHFFVCDGFDSGLLHINWGKNGLYNGFFSSMTILEDVYTFDIDFKAIIGLSPRISNLGNISDLYISDYYSQYLSELSGLPLYRTVPNVAEKIYSANINNSVDWRTIPYGGTSIYQAKGEVILQPGFTAEYGSDFTARIEPCAACEERLIEMDVYPSGVNYDTVTDASVEQRVYMKGDTAVVFRPSELRMHPNPTTGELTVSTSDDIVDMGVYDLTGKRVFRWFVVSKKDDSTVLDISALQSGVYILRFVTRGGKNLVGRFVKE